MSKKRTPSALPIQYRIAAIDDKPPQEGQRRSGEDPGRFEFVVSSEEPVRRWFGDEILLHDKGNVRTGRLDAGMVPGLFNHDMDKQIGIVDRYELKDGKLRVSGPFGPSPFAQEKRADYDAGVLRAASVGYKVHKMVRTVTEDGDGDEDPENPPRCEIQDWEPFDASLVTIPADYSVGAQRAEASTEFPVVVETVLCRSAQAEPAPQQTEAQPHEEKRNMPEVAVGPSAEQIELARRSDIMTVATDQDFRKYVTIDEAQEAIAKGTSSSVFREMVSRKIISANEASKVGTAGDNAFRSLSPTDQRRYSITRLARSMVNDAKPGTFRKEDADAGFEREFSQELKRTLRVQTEGVLYPINAVRALGTQTISSGTGQLGVTSEAAAVGTFTRPEVIELLRHRPRLIQLGARTLGGLTGIIRLPRQTGSNVAYWATEGASTTPSDLSMDYITLTPRRLTQQTSWTIELLAEASPDVESLARADLDKVANLALDLAGISGSGSNGQPTGIMSTSGLTLLSPSGTAFADGGKPLTWNDCLAFEGACAAADADVATSGWLFTPEVRQQLKGTPKFAAGYAMPIWDDGPFDPEGLQVGPLGYKAGVTNQLAKNGTKSGVTGSILHNAIFGDFSQIVFADWGVSEMIVDPYTQAGNGAVVVTSRSLHDVGIRHIASFVANPYIAIS